MGLQARDAGSAALAFPDVRSLTSSALRELDRGRWTVIDSVDLDGYVVDHVLVGPGTVYAVETEWRSGEVTREERRQLGEDATRRASQLKNLLKRQGAPASVVPLVVVWGPGTAGMPGPVEQVGPAKLLAGPDAKRWRTELEGTGSEMERNAPVLEALRAFVTRPDNHVSRIA